MRPALATRCLAASLTLSSAVLSSACSSERSALGATDCEAGCHADPAARVNGRDLAPVPELWFQLAEPADAGDYPYGPEAPAPRGPAPGSRVYLSAEGSRDPEGAAVQTFWNAQDPSGNYLLLDPSPKVERAAFTPIWPGTYVVTLQVSEVSGLQQTSQARLELQAAPAPCAPDGVSPPCDDDVVVPGGSFLMGSDDGVGHQSEQPRHRATVGSFALDRYEVTVGRFRRFVASYAPTKTRDGSGAHPLLPGSGWRAEWITTLPETADELAFAISECGGTWTDDVAGNEARPVTCLSWFEAFAFCAAQGRRLPTEAEWEYAAAGGDEQRPYPWGAEPPSSERAVFGCLFDGLASCSDADLPAAGSLPLGVGRFGHLDLAGSVWEWTLDAYAAYPAEACENCAALALDETPRVFRGGDYKFDDVDSLRAASRYAFAPAFPDPMRGVRCARSLSAAF